MEQIFAPAQATFVTFIFALLRCVGFFMAAPIFSNESLPDIFRAGAAAWLAVIITTMVDPVSYELRSVVELMLVSVGEIFLGLVMGTIADVFFSCIAMGGEVIGQQAGFAIASVLDPTTNQDVALMAQVNTLMAVIIFLVIGGHRDMLTAMLKSFELVEPGGITSVLNLGAFMRGEDSHRFNGALEIMTPFFKMGIKLAAPVLVTMILVSTCEAIMARTVPQVNIMMIGFGTRLLMGMFIMVSALPFIYGTFAEHVGRIDEVTLQLIYRYLRTGATSP